MKLSFVLAHSLRESRGSRGRIFFFLLCLAIGVAAVVAVASLAASLDGAVRGEARQLLAGDLKVSSRRPLPAELDQALASFPGVQRTDLKELVTIVGVAKDRPAGTAPADSQLVELKVVQGSYPFYGQLGLQPDQPLPALLANQGAVVAPDLLQRLGLQVGDSLRIGKEHFRISGTVDSEPDRLSFNLTMGPRVFIGAESFAATGLETLGSRIGYRALLKVPADGSVPGLETLKEQLEKALPDSDYFYLETYEEAQPALRQGLRRVERFLGLVALVSLLVGGIGVAQTVRAWLASRLDAVAVLKCLGLRPREAFLLYLAQAGFLGLAGSLLGALAGSLLPRMAPLLLGDLLPAQAVLGWQPAAIARGLGLGIGVALLFCVPPLMTVLRVPPLRVLRRSAEPLPAPRWLNLLTFAALLAGIALAAGLQSRSAFIALVFTGGTVVATGLLALAALGISRLARRWAEGTATWWLRYGLAALGRPAAGTVGAIVALGLGVQVVLAMALVQDQLARQLTRELPADSPTVFLVDIQPDQWPGVQSLLEERGAEGLDSVPVVMARLSAIDGRPVTEMVRQGKAEGQDKEDRDRRWALTREQRLTYLPSLADDNEILEGALWQEEGVDEVSVEAGFAKELGLKIGSSLRFDVQGVPLDLRVTSLRSVRWESFRINFFLVVEPGVLEGAPQFRIAAAHVAKAQEQPLQDRLSAAFPNVTVLRIREILDKISGVMGRLGLGVRFLGAFTVIAGLVILGGAVSATNARRGKEAALLKTLGVTRGGVLALFAVEYALVGLVAGLIGCAAGGVLAWAVLTQGMELAWTFEMAPFLIAVVGAAALTTLAGCGASLSALARRPIAVLRSED
jgi:putative ABC transport system permease protein